MIKSTDFQDWYGNFRQYFSGTNEGQSLGLSVDRLIALFVTDSSIGGRCEEGHSPAYTNHMNTKDELRVRFFSRADGNIQKRLYQIERPHKGNHSHPL